MSASRARAAGTTAIPNVFFDTFMTDLRDTEFRILLLIIRQTRGRQDGSGRRERDWISHAWFKERTGRASASISQAIARLVDLRLIEVTTNMGQPLPSRQERRAWKGRLYFRLAREFDGLFPQPLRKPSGSTSLSEDRKAKLTKEIETKDINRKGINAAAMKAVRFNGWQKADTRLPFQSGSFEISNSPQTYTDPDYPKTETLVINGPSGVWRPEWGDPK